jgi:hypothetical protein
MNSSILKKNKKISQMLKVAAFSDKTSSSGIYFGILPRRIIDGLSKYKETFAY